MGRQHKLLLPWGGVTLIEYVLQAWMASRVDRIVLVSRPDDHLLHQIVTPYSAVELVVPRQAPGEMKESVGIGLQHLRGDQPREDDRWMIAPADLPTITADLIDRVIAASRESSAIVVPQFGSRRGHPVSFPWSLSQQVDQLGANEGINRLLERFPVESLSIDAAAYPADVDTEDDYRRLLAAWRRGN
jgi:molybdenum cofactor cytidylyltransferase